MEHHYDAFISYRHLPADMAVAEKLQILLESRKNKDGKRLTVFRDKSDLPTSGDLGADIREALEHARFLIVVCTPSYRESKWCMEELRYFRSLHGNTNANILPVLVEGEPNDAFPELLRFEERTVLGQDGENTTARVEIEPLGADVRGANDRERKRKLRTEYLRIASPILGVSFDELYGRAQRRQRAVIALVMAALVAFGIYTSVMIAQITNRQKKLEEKQAELYENESKRLANQALELTVEDNAKAMLLSKAALPEDLTEPEYPLTDEAKLAIQSVALQHQLGERTDPFTQRSSIVFDNADWQVGKFYDEGRYLAVYDFNKTWLYDSHTGSLVTELPGVGYYFFDGINRFTREETVTLENGRTGVTYVVWDTVTGKEFAREQVLVMEYGESNGCFPIWEEASGRLWIARQHFDPMGDPRVSYTALGYFERNGSYTTCDTFPQGMEEECLENGMTTYQNTEHAVSGWNMILGEYQHSDEMPQTYRQIWDAFKALGGPYEAYAISLTDDGKLALIQFHNLTEDDYDTPGTAFWAVEEDHLLWISKEGCFWEADTNLIYRVMDNELQILEINPENFDLPTAPPIYELVSEDGKYGFARYYTDWSYQKVIGAFKTEDPGNCEFQKELGNSYYAGSSGNCLFEQETDGDYFAITPDGRRVALIADDKNLYVIDVENADVLVWADVSDQRVSSVTISNDGTMAAYAQKTDDGYEISLIDPDARTYVDCIRITGESQGEPYLEIGKGRLLVELDNCAYVYQLEDLEEDPWVIDLTGTLGFAFQGNNPQAFTDDGLLILPSEEVAAQGTLRRIKAIYEWESRKQVGFVNANTWHKEDFYYDEVGGNLIIRNNNSFAVERRGENGEFEVIYTITPKHNDMELNVAGHASDGEWLVLQNDEFCEIYELASGKLCYMLQKPTDRESQLAVIDGMLFDFCAGWTGEGILLPEVAEARAYVKNTLASDGDRRTLTDRECETYYVPSEWRDK